MATSAPLEPAAPHRGIKALLARYPLVSFFVMAYAFSWIVWAPWVLGENGGAGLPPIEVPVEAAARLLIAGAIFAGPTLAAFIMTATTEGREGVRRCWIVTCCGGWASVVPVRPNWRPPDHAPRHDSLLGDLPNLRALGGPSYLLSYLTSFVLVSSSEDRCSRKEAGAASRCLA